MRKLKRLPWATSEYQKLEPGDLDPVPAPTPEQRLRVAAAVATHQRDNNMLGKESGPNAESIRGILTMTAEQWARDMVFARELGINSYDKEDPRVRFDQVRRAFSS